MIAIRRNLMTQGGLVEATATGNPVTFSTTVAKPLKQSLIGMEPVQDLHGQDSPWPAGGGKNKFDPSVMPTPTSTIQYHAFFVGGGDWIASTDAPYVGGNATVFFLAGDVSSGASTLENGISPSSGRKQTAVDGYVTIAWRVLDDVDPSQYHVQIESGSTITAYAPYSNICPITGWTGATVTHTGKNLSVDFVNRTVSTQTQGYGANSQKTLLTNNIVINSLNYDADSWYSTTQYPITIQISGTTLKYTNNNANNAFGIGICVEVPSSARIYYGSTRTKTGANSSRCIFYDSDKYFISKFDASTGTYVDTPVNAKYALFTFRGTPQQEESITDFWVSCVENAGYSPYTGQTIPVTFPAMGKNLLNLSDTTWKKWYLNNNKLGMLTDDSSIVDYSVSGDEITVTITSGSHRGIGFSVDAVDYDRTVSVNGDVPGSIYLFDSYTANAGIARTGANNVLTIPANTSGFVAFRWAATGTDTIKVQFEKGSSATAYEPYTNTVYGGTVDLATGTLTVDRVCVDLGTMEWNYITNDGTPYYFRASPVGRKTGPFNVIASTLKTSATAGTRYLPDCGIIGSSSSAFVFVRYDAYQDASAFTAAMSGAQLVYELATPIIYQLTPQQITVLKGDNTLWSDTNGTNTVTYLKKK